MCIYTEMYAYMQNGGADFVCRAAVVGRVLFCVGIRHDEGWGAGCSACAFTANDVDKWV